MIGLDAILFGYRRLKALGEGRAVLITRLLRAGVGCREVGGGVVIIRESDVLRVRAALGGYVRYELSPPLGLPARLSVIRRHIPSLIAGILCSLLVIFLSSLVWEVRIQGADAEESLLLEESLAECGFSVGRRWENIDLEEVELSLLEARPELAWVHINRRGTVATVTVMPKEGAPLSGTQFEASNIVADFDGVIEEITVNSGLALVSPGQVVRRGDILISGVITTEGGTVLTRAEGSVIAHVAGSVSATAVTEEHSEETVRGEPLRISLNILGFSINIFKKYSKEAGECDIIDDEEECLYIGGRRLPISLEYEYSVNVAPRVEFYAESDLPGIASERLSQLLSDVTAEGDLIKLRTREEATDGSYTLTADYVIAREIGKEIEIGLEDR